MEPYYELLTDRTPQEIAAIQKGIAGRHAASHATPRCGSQRRSFLIFTAKKLRAKPPRISSAVFRDRQAPEESKSGEAAASSRKKLTALLRRPEAHFLQERRQSD